MSGERAVDVEDWTACAEGFLEEDEALRAAGVVAEREPDRGSDREGRVPSRSGRHDDIQGTSKGGG